MLDVLASQPDHQAAVKAVWSRALAGEEFVETGEFGDPTRDRRSYEMRYNSLRDDEGRRIGAYQFVYDVTERQRDQQRLRHAEESLLQAQKLESLGQLTGGVAHDFNNLLAVFTNGLHLIERGVSAEQQQRVFASMRRAISRGSGLTHQLLAFSRRRPINPISIDLASHLGVMRDLLARSLRGDIRIAMEVADDLWPVEIDAGEFELAMLNVCVNARDAMPEGGTITISARNARGMANDGVLKDLVRIRVRDDGCGMPPEVMARVFEPFFTTKDVGKGSGLGLPQVYGFVQQSGGQVELESEVGKGTSVTLILPRCLQQPAEEGAASPLPGRGRTHRGQVLLVEDDEEVAALTREMLSGLGFTVIHAATAAAALGALANGRGVDIVFSDIMMPGGVSGVELAREVRRRQPNLPVVLTTGYSEATSSVNSGEFRVLLKPYSVEELSNVLAVHPYDGYEGAR
jgi:signal transduction histidine kinase/CheY-like chemotaxis protein